MPILVKHSENLLKLSQRLGYQKLPKSIRNVSGGCIHQAEVWTFQEGETYFVKRNTESAINILRAEAIALTRISSTQTVTCPIPIFCDSITGFGSILVMNHLHLFELNPSSAQELGKALAKLHSNQSSQYGFETDNFIGSTSQPNDWDNTWSSFFWNKRLNHQLQLASGNGYSFNQTASLEGAVKNLLGERNPPPSLLHGDLWGGNVGTIDENIPVIFDPASYYGDPETDLAFTEMFGGFPPEFYQSYKESTRWDHDGYVKRKPIYNLYHYLNHLNLFGSSYHSSCTRIIDDTIHRYG